MRPHIASLIGAMALSGSAFLFAGGQAAPPRSSQRPPAATARPGECPAGQTEVREGRCQAPETPPPSIVDYRPKSTLVVTEHVVPKAKFPVVDIHSHQSATAENMARLVREMDALN